MYSKTNSFVYLKCFKILIITLCTFFSMFKYSLFCAYVVSKSNAVKNPESITY